ncbi:unnamed protein product, partial [Hapterophycus canaliculatus]
DFFGALSLIFVGDPVRLPGVGAAPMWTSMARGGELLSFMNAAVELTQVVQQLGPAQAAFRRTLLSVTEGAAGQSDWSILHVQYTTRVDEAERRSFEEAVHIFAINTEADDWNWRRITDLRTGIARVNADRTIGGYAGVASDRFRGLHGHLFLAVGPLIFIINKVWTSTDLANGAAGEVVQMQGAPHTQPPTLYEVVWVRIDGHRVQQYLDEPLRRSYVGGSNPHAKSRCIRTQLPRVLAFGVTKQKSQGTTLLRCFSDIGAQEKSDGHTF